MKTIRVAVGISDWPESNGEKFDIVTAKDGESDADLITRAKSKYSPDLEVEIEHRALNSDPAKIKGISKFLSFVLRHAPETISVTLDKGGWVEVNTLIKQSNKYNHKLDLATLEEVVAENNKQRFAFSEDRTKIRASQGHSIPVDLGYASKVPPVVLYHGTAVKHIESIRKNGLLAQSRHHVHLSAEKDTARSVGSRHGTPVILIVNAKQMLADGHEFFESDNGVWLTESVPPKYFTEEK
jgi:putative RNA 2'-phosphotransferase